MKKIILFAAAVASAIVLAGCAHMRLTMRPGQTGAQKESGASESTEAEASR